MTEKKSEITLLRDKQWSVIDGEPCLVIDFRPFLHSVKGGKVISHGSQGLGYVPYASVTIECKKLPERATGFICHKMDFVHLWLAFKERTIGQDEEVIIYWSRKHYKYKFLRLLWWVFAPRLWVMVCPKGAFELFDSSFRPELQGEARWKAEGPIVDWKPEIMR